jgi:serine/threonine protein kinase
VVPASLPAGTEAGATLPTIPGFVIESRIDEGAMGEVYLARQTRLSRRVAIKFLKQEFCNDPNYLARTEREGQVLASLNHPNIIACHDQGEHLGRKYMVVEYVQGETLGSVVAKRGFLPQDEALYYLKQAVLGLDHACAQGIIHRDVKPENMLLAKAAASGTAVRVPYGHTLKISDLGLATFTERQQDDTRLTRDGALVGSPVYMSPEQTRSERVLDFRSDMFALGITAYYMLTGVVPYDGASVTLVLVRKLAESIPDPRSHRPELLPWVSLLLQRATARDKEDRYTSYGALLQDIEAIEQGKPLTTPALSAARATVVLLPDTLRAIGAPDSDPKSGAAESQPAALPAPSRRVAPPAQRRTSAFLLVGTALLLAALVVAGVLASRKPSPASLPAGTEAGATGTATPELKRESATPAAAEFETQFLIEGESIKGWTYQGDAKDFGFQDGAMFLQNLKDWNQAQHALPASEYTLRAMVQVPVGADECEVQVGISETDYVALGVRLPRTVTRPIAYLERRDVRTHAVLEAGATRNDLSESEWQLLRVVVQDGLAVCFIENKPMGTMTLAGKGPPAKIIRIAVHKGLARFQSIELSPVGRAAVPAGRTPK